VDNNCNLGGSDQMDGLSVFMKNKKKNSVASKHQMVLLEDLLFFLKPHPSTPTGTFLHHHLQWYII